MPRKSSTTTRSKKTTAPAEPAAVQPVPVQVAPEVEKPVVEKPLTQKAILEKPVLDKPIFDKERSKVVEMKAPAIGEKKTPVMPSAPAKIGVNLDDEIRLRAYELYLQRNGAAGDPNRDWLIAEREIRSRHASHQIHTS